jgi:hypothetical protein
MTGEREKDMKGRRKKQESRATEFRQKLMEWNRMPESDRPSLRELALELGTSHQLLQHYLVGLDRWECDEVYRQAQAEKDVIQRRAKAENRPLTPWEQERFRFWDRTGVRASVRSSFLRQLEDMKERAKKGPLHRLEVKSIQIFVKCGIPGAQELLDKCSKMGVKPRKRFSTIVKDTPQRMGESDQEWIGRLLDESEKYETDCPLNLTVELLNKYAGKTSKRPADNLPVIESENAKSFRSVGGDAGNSAKAEGRRRDALV